MANLSAIKLPNGTTYNLKDNGALQLTGGSVTGPVSFGDSVSIDEATVGDLVVNGSASFTNNLQANTINGVAVGSSPKFTDTTYSSLAAASGGTAVSLVTTGEKYRWNSKTSNTGTITSVKTTAGAHTTVNVTSGAVSFNVPTTAAHVGAVPTTRKVNNKALSSDITLTASDVGATKAQELTQAEYDTLTTEEKNNGTVYYITDGQPEKYIVNDSVPIGAIQAYGGATAPANWLMCDGSAVSRTTYSELFSAIGTSFGEGDGSTTFNLPDLRGRTAIGSGLGTAPDAVERSTGQVGGSERVTLTTAQMPSHTHNYSRAVAQWGTASETSLSTAQLQSNTSTATSGAFFSDRFNNAAYKAVVNTGGGESHGNMPPYVATNYIIKAKDHSVLQTDLLPMLDLFYPVGCYFETSDSSFDPNVSIGGTWTGNTSLDNELIEEGTSGIWTYRKWSNGIAECWGTYSKSIAANTVDISNYITYPFTFTSKPFITTGLQGGGADLYRGHVEPAQTNASQVRLVLINKHTAAVTIYMGMHAIGTWKTYTAPTITYKWHRTT